MKTTGIPETLNKWSPFVTLMITLLVIAGGIVSRFVYADRGDFESLSTSYDLHVEDEDIHMPLSVKEAHFVTHPVFDSTISAIRDSQQDFKTFLERERDHTDRQFEELKDVVLRLDSKIDGQ
jgi:hypothetical protein